MKNANASMWYRRQGWLKLVALERRALIRVLERECSADELVSKVVVAMMLRLRAHQSQDLN